MKSTTAYTLSLSALAIGAALGVAGVCYAGAASDPPPQTEVSDCGNTRGSHPHAAVIPSITVTVCEHCNFGEVERYALLGSYAARAARAGYIIDPHHRSAIRIIETGVLPSGKSYLKVLITGKEFVVFEVKAPRPGATLATVTGRMALVMVASKL